MFDQDKIVQPDRLLTTSQAAERLGLAAQTIRNWRCSGKGPTAVVIGTRTIRYRESALTRFMDSLSAGEVAA